MTNFEVPVDLILYIQAESPEQAYGKMQTWFTALSSGNFDSFTQMRTDGTIFPSSWNTEMEEITSLAEKREGAIKTSERLEVDRVGWKLIGNDEADD